MNKIIDEKLDIFVLIHFINMLIYINEKISLNYVLCIFYALRKDFFYIFQKKHCFD